VVAYLAVGVFLNVVAFPYLAVGAFLPYLAEVAFLLHQPPSQAEVAFPFLALVASPFLPTGAAFLYLVLDHFLP